MLDIANAKADFPALAGGAAYLDSAATAHKPAVVLEAMDAFYRERYAPVSRGNYAATEAATVEFEQARKTVADFIGAADSSEITFTQNATGAIDLVARCWAAPNLEEGDAILITEMEHHSNIVPWQLLAKERKLELRCARITDDGRIDLEDFKRKLPGAKLVSVMHASNVMGTINPVDDLAALAHEAGAKILVDGAQAVPSLPVDVSKLGADWYVFSGHKCYGPTGIGVLWSNGSVYSEMEPAFGGGGTIQEVTLEETEFLDPPAKFEAGTQPVAEAIGLAAAVKYLDSLGMPAVIEHARILAEQTIGAFSDIKGLRILGPADPSERVGLVAFTIDGIHPNDLATSLDHDGIAVRSGRHCTHLLHRRLGLEASARASFGVYTVPEDIERLAAGIVQAQKTLA